MYRSDLVIFGGYKSCVPLKLVTEGLVPCRDLMAYFLLAKLSTTKKAFIKGQPDEMGIFFDKILVCLTRD